MVEILPGISEWKLLAMVVKAIKKTNADEQVISYVADEIKEQIPEHEIEPVIAEVLIDLGNELKKTN